MSTHYDLEKCSTFINCQISARVGAPGSITSSRTGHRAVTISRQTGSGGDAVAEKLAVVLQQTMPGENCAWTVFDRNLVEKVLDDHHLPKRLAQFLPEDRVSEMTDTLDELFGLRPSSWTLVRQTAETILRLCELGHVIIIGRAASVITAKLDGVFHVRLVSPLESRASYLQKTEHMTPPEALRHIRKQDLGRARYCKKHFGADIDDPLLYHLVINTDRNSFDDTARLIGKAMASGKTECLIG